MVADIYIYTHPTWLRCDETQRCQLYHHDVVVAQLAVLGFIKSV